MADAMMDTGRIKPGVRWLSAEIKNGELTTATPRIEGEQITDNGGGFTQFDCRDVNGDGYDDLVAYALWPGDKNTNAYPIVYLNQKDGTFKRTSVYTGQNFTTGVPARQHTSLMWDFTGDGIEDLVVFPATPGDATSMQNAVKLYRGLKQLDR